MRTSTDGKLSGGLLYPGRCSADAPHQSTTLIVQIKALEKGRAVRLTGPGIEAEKMIQLAGVNSTLLEERNQIEAHYPLGIDIVFVSHYQLMAIPRTTHMEILEANKWM